MNKEKEVLTFRMYAGVRMNRDINPEKDYVSPGGYEMVMDGKKINFDFEEYIGGRVKEDDSLLEIEVKNPDWNTFPEMKDITKDMLRNITEITEFFVYTGEPGESDLKPISLEYVSFVFPYDNWEEIQVAQNVVESACVTSN